jgi:CCR4-NOT transcription complex subunit 1
MPQLLLSENQKVSFIQEKTQSSLVLKLMIQGWPALQRLLIVLFQFLAPYLKQSELEDTTRMLYRGTLRVLLVLLHDFPEFLCDYHASFCDAIPSTCIQMRNLILSAFPRHMRLPDPFTPNLKIDLLPEIHQSPRVLTDIASIIEENGIRKELDGYLAKPFNSTHFLKDLATKLKENGALMNAVVFYIGTVSISNGIPVHKGPALDVYQYLLVELDSEGERSEC